MERIVYRKTLDVHKNGIQFTLQGFETADKMSRRIVISLMASGDTIDLPLEQITAMMYVTTPNAIEPSINECTIKDNTIIYDVLPIVEEGITEMQLKLIETSVGGAKSVLATPKFVVEVVKSNVDDESAEQTPTYTALEDAIAQAKGVYDSRLIRIEIDSDCMFRAYYADGNVYESDVLKELYLKGESLLSQSYARGGTGIRAGEDTDNSMYYSEVSKSASEKTKDDVAESKKILTEVRKHGVYTSFSINFETGEVEYISPLYSFNVNEETGELDAIGVTYSPEGTVERLVNEWINSKNAEIELNLTDVNDAISVERERINALGEDVVANTSKISNLETQAAGLDEKVTTLENSVNNHIDNEYARFKSQFDTLATTVGENYNDIQDLKVDYIVEQDSVQSGTQLGDVWRYRKWASGIAEMWGTFRVVPEELSEEFSQDRLLPFKLIAVDFVAGHINAHSNITYAPDTFMGTDILDGYEQVRCVFTKPPTTDYRISVLVKGLWK